MTIDELVKGGCLNARGLLRMTRYNIRRFNSFYRNKRYQDLSPEMQRMINVLHKNLTLLYNDRTFYTDYEGLRVCQVKTCSKAFRITYPLLRQVKHHNSLNYRCVDKQAVRYLLDLTERFINFPQ